MNLLSSHDTARVRTVLGSGHDGNGLTREEQAHFTLSKEQNARGRALQKLCAALQFTLPGMPSVYYGDEEGMTGFRDPFSRAPYVRKEDELREYYAELANLRRESSALKHGDVAFCAPDADVICLLRFDGEETYLVAVNRGDSDKSLTLSAADFEGAAKAALSALPAMGEITVAAMDCAIVKL